MSGDGPARSPATIEENRLRFLKWLLSVRDWTAWNFAFDLTDKPPPEMDDGHTPYWWPLRAQAVREYCDTYIDQPEPATTADRELLAFPLVLVYLLALECAEGGVRQRDARELLDRLIKLEHLPSPATNLARGVREGDLPYHTGWIGPLEWSLLQAAGVKWPTYNIALAGLGEGCADELDREVGLRLDAGLYGFRPASANGELWPDESLARYSYMRRGTRDRRVAMIEWAAQAAVSRGRSLAQRTDSALGLVGAWLLLLRSGDTAPLLTRRELLRTATCTRVPGLIGLLASRILRAGDHLNTQDMIREFWTIVEGVDAEMRRPDLDDLPGSLGDDTPTAHQEVAREPGPRHLSHVPNDGYLRLGEVELTYEKSDRVRRIKPTSQPARLLVALALGRPPPANVGSSSISILRQSLGRVPGTPVELVGAGETLHLSASVTVSREIQREVAHHEVT